MDKASKLWRDEQGNVGLLFGLSIVPLLAFAGGAVDLAKQNRYNILVQSALDTAVLAGARDVAEQIKIGGINQINYQRAEERATLVFKTAIGPLGDSIDFVVSHEDTRIIASSEWAMPTSFLPVVGLDSLRVIGHAEADIEATTENCVYVTAERERGVSLSASSEFNSNCGVRVESVSERAISATASSDMTASQICANGGTFLWATSTVTPLPIPCDEAYRDPLAHLAVPTNAKGACDFQDVTVKGRVRLKPGIYCGLTTIEPASHAVLESGEFVFRDGALVIGSGSSAFGDDILLYFQGKNSGLRVGNGSKFVAHGRLEGEFAGVLIYVDRDCAACSNVVEAGGQAEIEGTVYAPTAGYTVQSRASSVSASHAFFIVYQLTLESSASFTVNRYATADGVPEAYQDQALVRMVK